MDAKFRSYEISIVDVAGSGSMGGAVTLGKGDAADVRPFLYPPQLCADPVAAALLAVQGSYLWLNEATQVYPKA